MPGHIELGLGTAHQQVINRHLGAQIDEQRVALGGHRVLGGLRGLHGAAHTAEEIELPGGIKRGFVQLRADRRAAC